MGYMWFIDLLIIFGGLIAINWILSTSEDDSDNLVGIIIVVLTSLFLLWLF